MAATLDGMGQGAEPITLWWLMTRLGQPLSLPDQIAAQVAERILTGALPPGTPVTEQGISADFGVSRAPVREALRILERQGLVQINPRKGTVVTLITEQSVRDLAEIRGAFYRVVAQRLAGSGNPEVMARLESKAQDLLAFAEDPRGPDRYLWGALDLSLTMARDAGNQRIADILEELGLQTYRYARLSALAVPQRQKTARLWRDSVRAMKRLDASGAAATLTRIAEYARDEAVRQLAIQARQAGDSPSASKR